MSESKHEINNLMYPLVSVISPCYNGEKYLKGFLDSMLNQTYPNVELIFVDDGSRDHTPEIAKSYKELFEERNYAFHYIKADENRGAAAAVNLGLPLVKGDFLMWVDSDDILFPENIQEKVSYLNKHLEKDFVLCQLMTVNADALNIPITIEKRSVSPNKSDTLAEDLLYARNVVYGPGTILVRKSAFEKAIPSNSIYESRQGQNYQLMLPLAFCCKCGYIDKVLVKYVIHADSHAHTQRSYKECIARQRDFILLIKETLSSIPTMNTDDYTRLMSIAKQTLLNNELRISLRNGHLVHYYKVCHEMKKERLRIHRNHKPLYYYGSRLKRRILSFFKHTE